MKIPCRMAWFAVLCPLPVVLTLFWTPGAAALEVSLSEVRRLAELPVDRILRDTPVDRLTDEDFRQRLRENHRPAVVVFYINRQKRSRYLATMIRYLSFAFQERISFYAYKVADETAVSDEEVHRLRERYSLDRIPGTFIYDPGGPGQRSERKPFRRPSVKEYRTPNMLLWETYYRAVVQYMNRIALGEVAAESEPQL